MKYLFIFFISFNLIAVTPIKKGDVAKSDGFIFTKKEERELRKRDMERIQLKDLRVAHNDMLDIQKRQLKMYKNHFDASYTTPFEKTLWFIGGMLTTGLMFYGTSKILDNIRN